MQVAGACAGLGLLVSFLFVLLFFKPSWPCWLKMLLRMLCCRAAVLLCRSRAGDDGTPVQQVAARTCRSICRSGDLAALADDEDAADG